MQTTKVRPFREVVQGEKPGEWTLRVNLHEGQKRVNDSVARFPVMMAGSQGGKTCYGPHWLHREIKNCGEGDYIVGTSSFPLLSNKLLPEFRELFEIDLHLGVYKEQRRVFEFHDGKHRVLFFSADNPESAESATAKAAWLDECGQKMFKRDTHEAIERRLAIHRGRILYTTSLYTFGWFKTEIYDRWKAGDKNYEVIQFDSTMNPMFSQEEYERLRAKMPSWKFNMYHRGLFDKAVGLVYDCFDENIQKIARDAMPPGWERWPVYVGHDFGTVNPAAVFLSQNPGTGDFFLWAEYKPGPGYSGLNHIAEWRRITEGRTVLKRVGGSHQEEETREGYTARGWSIMEPKVLRVEAGILKVYEVIKRRRFYILSDMLKTLDEQQSYSYKLNDKYEPIDEIEDKSSFHLMDALRYILSDFASEPLEGHQQSPRNLSYASF